MPTEKGTLPFEEAAELRDVSVWVCKTCGKDYSTEGERLARLCCAKDQKCGTSECDARVPKDGYIDCDTCRKKNDVARWTAYPEVPWNGETPLCLDDDDRYFFSPEELDLFIEEHDLKIEDLRLVICVADTKPRFDVLQLVEDYLGSEDIEVEEEERVAIEKTVNDWVDDHLKQMWYPGKTRPTLESVKSK